MRSRDQLVFFFARSKNLIFDPDKPCSFFVLGIMVLYDIDRITKIYNSVPYANCRLWSFYSRNTDNWYHPRRLFKSPSQLKTFVQIHSISDIHVKGILQAHEIQQIIRSDAVISPNLREHVIDVDLPKPDEYELTLLSSEMDIFEIYRLKIKVISKSFELRFNKSILHLLYSGNRGVHVWLKPDPDKFNINDSDDDRLQAVAGCRLPLAFVVREPPYPTGSFINYFWSSVLFYRAEIDKIYTKRLCTQQIFKYFFPCIDEQVLKRSHSVRAPFSFNSNGNKYNKHWSEC